MATAGDYLYVTNFSLGTVSRYSTSGQSSDPSFITGLGGSFGIAISGNFLFVTGIPESGGLFYDSTPENVAEYDLTTGDLINPNFITGLDPDTYAASIFDGDLYLTNTGDGTVGEYDATTGAAIDPSLISGLGFPQSILVASQTPEPSTWALVFAGLGLMAFWRFSLRKPGAAALRK